MCVSDVVELIALMISIMFLKNLPDSRTSLEFKGMFPFSGMIFYFCLIPEFFALDNSLKNGD